MRSFHLHLRVSFHGDFSFILTANTMLIIAFILATIIHFTMSFYILKFLLAYINIPLTIILYVLHLLIFNGCVLTYIVDKNIYRLFGYKVLENYNFYDTWFYKIISSVF